MVPEIVLEVAFDGIQPSARHASGYALRFPRILRIRDDKAPAEADHLHHVAALFQAQVATGHREEIPAPHPVRTSARRRKPAPTKTDQLNLFGELTTKKPS